MDASARPPASSRTLETLPLVVLLAVTLLLGSVSLIFPFGRDQGIHAYVGDAMLSGQVFYRDAYDFKPPLTYFIHALALLLFGHSMLAIRLLDLLWTLATAFLIYLLLARTLRRNWTAALGAALYPFQYYVLGYWYTAQTDGWLNLPLAAALLCVVLARENDAVPRRFRQSWLAAGALIGIAFLFKYTAAALLPVLLALGWLRYRGRPLLARDAILTQLAGFCVPVLLMLGYLLISGALPAFLESQFRLVPAYARVGIQPGFFQRFSFMFTNLAANTSLRLSSLLGLAGVVIAIVNLAQHPVRRPPSPPESATPDSEFGVRRSEFTISLLALLWLLVAGVSLFAQGRFFGYHYLPVFAPLALLAGLALDPIIRRLRHTWSRLTLVCAVLLGLTVFSDYPRYFRVMADIARGEAALRDYWSSQTMGSSFLLGEQLDLADYLQQSTRVQDKAFIWGFDPLVNFVARRRSPTRFIYNLPVAAAYANPALRPELLATLTRDPPLVFVVAHRDETPWVMGHELDSYATLMEFAQLRDFLTGNYKLETQVGRYDVWRRGKQ